MKISALLLILALAAGGCSARGETGSPKGGKEKGSKSAPPTVAVVRPKIEKRGQARDYTGSIESTNQVALVSQLAGQLESVLVQVGDPVHRGQLLATVDDSQLEAQVSQARATAEAARSGVQTAMANHAAARDQVLAAQQAVAQAKAQIIQAEAAVSKAATQVRLTNRNLKRVQSMAEKDLIAAQVVDEAAALAETAAADYRSATAQYKAMQGQEQQARLRADTARDQEAAAGAQVATAKAQLASQESALRLVEVRRGYTRLRSPIDGVVIARPLDPGSYVAPGGATPVLVVASMQGLRVSFQLSEADVPLVRPGQRIKVRFDALPKLQAEAVVQRMAGGLDPSTRTVRVEVKLAKSTPGLRPGMLARLSVEGEPRPVLTVPLQAVVSQGDDHFVWTLGPEDKAQKRRVEVEQLEGDRAYIKSGLSEKDAIVVRGVDLVQEGKQVLISEEKG